MQIHELQRKNPNKKSRRVGRGGLRGKTSGRGHKGQKQHGGHGMRPEIRDQIKKLPKLRGRGINSNTPNHPKKIAVNVATLESHFSNGEVVSPETLKDKGIVKGAALRKSDIKILGNGELTKKITVEGCFVSKTASEKISKAGGSVS